jgi:glycosidase
MADRPAPAPLLYEVNARQWLHALSRRHGRRIDLASVPENELDGWSGLGVTHLWLMGVWPTGPLSRAQALADEGLRRAYAHSLPDWSDRDVLGSPYALADAEVWTGLGGDSALSAFRARLHARGLRLILDFVPNHLGLDHPWLRARPHLFVHSRREFPGSFRCETRAGDLFLAHGKDPHFPPWTDTAQLDYRRAATRAAMTELLASIAARCDGVRCDMAMLVLRDVFARTWEHTADPEPETAGEFWAAAIPRTRSEHPDFVFLAEAYWGLEPRLLELGFDFTYDKTLYDLVLQRRGAGIQEHLLSQPPALMAASAHFLENHDEPRVAAGLGLPEHRAAALLVLALPGMRFLHDGQLEGLRRFARIQLARRAPEPEDPEIAALYRGIASALAGTCAGRGEGRVLRTRRAWSDNRSDESMVLVQWQGDDERRFDLVVVNLGPHRSQCYAPISARGLARGSWRMTDLLGSERYERDGAETSARGLYLDVPPHAAQVFRFERID